jgi:hypothetical protein
MTQKLQSYLRADMEIQPKETTCCTARCASVIEALWVHNPREIGVGEGDASKRMLPHQLGR